MIVDLEQGARFARHAVGQPGANRVFEGVASNESAPAPAADVMPGGNAELQDIVPGSAADIAARATAMRVALSRILPSEVRVEDCTPRQLQILVIVAALVHPNAEIVVTAEAMHGELIIEQAGGVGDVDSSQAPMLIRPVTAASSKSVMALEREIRETTRTRDTLMTLRQDATAAQVQIHLDMLMAELAQRQ